MYAYQKGRGMGDDWETGIGIYICTIDSTYKEVGKGIPLQYFRLGKFHGQRNLAGLHACTLTRNRELVRTYCTAQGTLLSALWLPEWEEMSSFRS